MESGPRIQRGWVLIPFHVHTITPNSMSGAQTSAQGVKSWFLNLTKWGIPRILRFQSTQVRHSPHVISLLRLMRLVCMPYGSVKRLKIFGTSNLFGWINQNLLRTFSWTCPYLFKKSPSLLSHLQLQLGISGHTVISLSSKEV